MRASQHMHPVRIGPYVTDALRSRCGGIVNTLHAGVVGGGIHWAYGHLRVCRVRAIIENPALKKLERRPRLLRAGGPDWARLPLGIQWLSLHTYETCIDRRGFLSLSRA